MKTWSKVIVITIASCLSALVAGAPAHAAEITVVAGAGPLPDVMGTLLPMFEKATGNKVKISFKGAPAIAADLKQGAADLVITNSEVVDELATSGDVARDGKTLLMISKVGIAVKAGAKRPDVSTPEALKKALLNAKSITYAAAGASRPPTDKMLGSMGIADALKSKTLLLSGAEETAAAVRDGKAEILITLISEIMSAKGLALAGPLPKEFQAYIGFAAGVSPNAKNAEAAKAAVKYLTGPKAAAAYKAKGMEPGK